MRVHREGAAGLVEDPKPVDPATLPVEPVELGDLLTLVHELLRDVGLSAEVLDATGVGSGGEDEADPERQNGADR